MAFDREELAWAGGFITGEGGFYRNKEGSGWVMRAYQKDPRPLLRVGIALHMGRLYRGYDSRNIRSIAVYGFEKCQAIVAMLWPWLSEEKQGQWKALLEKGM